MWEMGATLERRFDYVAAVELKPGRWMRQS